MDGPELKEALIKRYPVTCNGIPYSYISAIIYRSRGGRIVVSAELMDVNSNSVTVAEAKRIERSPNEVQ